MQIIILLCLFGNYLLIRCIDSVCIEFLVCKFKVSHRRLICDVSNILCVICRDVLNLSVYKMLQAYLPILLRCVRYNAEY